MVPEDLPSKALLVPVDISDEDTWGEIYEGHEELVETIGLQKVAEAVVAAFNLFEKNKTNFKESERPIEMTVGEWKDQPCDDETDDDEDDDDEDEAEQEEGEEEAEEEDDAEDDEPAAKKAKTA